MELSSTTLLQGGKYRIEKVIGRGGTSFTYLALQVGLNRKVAIKEFFMRKFCNRDAETLHVIIPSEENKEFVARFRHKFIKEAQAIAELDNRHIIRVHDIFEENDTAYYVMEYLQGGDLSDRIPQAGMAEAEAVGYIRQIADALAYIHEHNILHLDIKPLNILFRGDEAVLIDFGLSKHYDVSGDQTTTTPIAVSHGYAPMEQYKSGGVASFSPATDIYSLGATLYKLLTGQTPPDASDVFTDGLPVLPSSISSSVCNAIAQAMFPNRKNRPQSAAEFLALLDKKPVAVDENTDEEANDDTDYEVFYKTASTSKSQPKPQPQPAPAPTPQPTPTSSKNKWLVPALIAVIVALAIVFWPKGSSKEPELPIADTTTVVSVVVEDSVALAPIKEETPTMSSLYITTSPSGAIVYIDNKQVGTTPIEGKEVSSGRHTIKISKSGYENFSVVKQFDDKPMVLNHTLVVEQTVLEEQRRLQALAGEKEKRDEQLKAKLSSPTGTINGHGYVDLGLSVKWADRNIGAGSPGDYGDYFAWAETGTKSEYPKANNETYEKAFGDIGGNSQYDAARANWGGSWRLPTKSETEELINRCHWNRTTQGGHNGYQVVGPNGNSIFLPSVGWRNGEFIFYIGECGNYWSSTPDEDLTEGAYGLCFGSEIYVTWRNRGDGCSIRPVSD